MALTPYEGPKDEDDLAAAAAERHKAALALMKPEDRDRMDMSIRTEDFNTKPGVVIPVDDIPDEVVNQYYLSPEKSDLKRTIWMAQHADWIKEQEKKQNKPEEHGKIAGRHRAPAKGVMSQISEVSQSGMTPNDIGG